MLRRGKKQLDYHSGKWNGLGGKFNPGETPEACVIREVREESGLLITMPKLRGFLSFPLFDGESDWYCFVFTADQFEGKLIEDCPEGELAWIDSDKLMDLELWPGDYKFLPWVFQDRLFSACFHYEKKELKDYSVTFY